MYNFLYMHVHRSYLITARPFAELVCLSQLSAALMLQPSTSKTVGDRGDTKMAADSQRKYPKPILESCFTNPQTAYQRNNKAKGIKACGAFPLAVRALVVSSASRCIGTLAALWRRSGVRSACHSWPSRTFAQESARRARKMTASDTYDCEPVINLGGRIYGKGLLSPMTLHSMRLTPAARGSRVQRTFPREVQLCPGTLRASRSTAPTKGVVWAGTTLGLRRGRTKRSGTLWSLRSCGCQQLFAVTSVCYPCCLLASEATTTCLPPLLCCACEK